jgi:adenylate kinase
MSHKQIVLVYGPQGSGKSTQAEKLAMYLDFKFLSSGELLRKLRTENNPVGIRLAQYWVSGELVPDDLIESILFPILDNEDYKGFVIDGYPRNIDQLKSFKVFLNLKGWKINQVFYLDVGVAECIRRMKIRAVEEERLDETDEAIAKRLDIYYEKTQPLLGEYEKMEILIKVDGEREIDEIQSDLQTLSNSLNNPVT